MKKNQIPFFNRIHKNIKSSFISIFYKNIHGSSTRVKHEGTQHTSIETPPLRTTRSELFRSL